ncbi:MAG: cytochrome c peroxidase [Roseiflexaceae bacterium]|nr:cytochrome c peroxidase [Roseiflexaceae bacterium]
MSRQFLAALLTLSAAIVLIGLSVTVAAEEREPQWTLALDRELRATLQQLGFTGQIEASLERQLGRRVNHQLADIGRMLWFDPIGGLNGDNTCAGCHSPTNGFGDTQSIAIGIENNRIVGPDRAGPRNMRRTPMVINTALYPNLMWNSRFIAHSGDPFDNSAGFEFPPPEGRSLTYLSHLLVAQAFIPPTERTEAAGFDVPGDNYELRAELMRRLNAASGYRELFGRVYPEVRAGAPITIEMFAQAISEFEFTLTFANAPIDRYARGDVRALTTEQKQGALLFFGKAGCVRCHGVSGPSSELFSDFQLHSIGVPQIAPSLTNNSFDGPGANEDFGREQVTGNVLDRYKFRTSPLRNIALQPTFMHNGAYTSLEDAIRHHLDVRQALLHYTPTDQMLDPDLAGSIGPSAPLLDQLDQLLRPPIHLTEDELHQLVAFVRDGLLDPRAKPERLRRLVPKRLPSGLPGLTFQFP